MSLPEKIQDLDFEKELQNYIYSYMTLDPQVWDDFFAQWEEIDFERNESITSSGETENYIYFVVQGTQRVYYINEDGKEATLVLSYPFSFAGVVDSFLLKKPSKYFYETLTRSKLYRLNHSTLSHLRGKYPSVDKVIEHIIYVQIGGLLERMVELQCFSSEQKFRSLLKRSPHVLQVVPHKYLANYLGIDPTNFSKLINSVRI
ncbi:cyclic nucleotide-binding domain-containing protein [Paracrocinitomix mangrovi]|uniref:Crp/Fnr family transcriptional regulator n=1 Tax=Paracrocinitomix mangrovi TaxID=2862509 RepID=UPI001C8DE4A4|nr:cyclic nucleotide-binding domain-containing protein [Paracrocinitomix mangrovi]UKN02266.1 cyclic nucleotide-binding domain-containing protein [Paracrocinitomix mangrovi]